MRISGSLAGSVSSEFCLSAWNSAGFAALAGIAFRSAANFFLDRGGTTGHLSEYLWPCFYWDGALAPSVLVAVIVNAFAQRHLGVWLWYSLLALPLVRSEGLAISVSVLCSLASQGRVARARALLTGLILVAGLVSFSAFLAGLGLGQLPSSLCEAVCSNSRFGFWSLQGNGPRNVRECLFPAHLHD